MREHLRGQLKWSQALQKEQADRRRLPAPEFKVGDMVMLDRRNIKTKRPNKSLDHKNIGPYAIKRAIDNFAYELDLPENMGKVHPVFHPWLLHLDNSDPLPGQVIAPPPPVDTDEEGDIYDALEVLESKIDGRMIDPATRKKGCLKYKVLFTGHADPDWIPYRNTAGCPDLVADFHHAHPEAVGPHSTFERPAEWTPLIAQLICEWTQESTWSVSGY